MKVSTKGRYALRMVLDLATHDSEEPVRIKEIAKRQGISVKYLEQIVSGLAKAGYVTSMRGPSGGYRLAGDPKDYTVGMILRATEGDMAPVDCLVEAYDECEKCNDCVTRRLWKEMDDAIRAVIDKYTLADLLSWEMGNYHSPDCKG